MSDIGECADFGGSDYPSGFETGWERQRREADARKDEVDTILGEADLSNESTSPAATLRRVAAELEKEERAAPASEKTLRKRIADLEAELKHAKATIDSWEARGAARVAAINKLEDQLSEAKEALARSGSETSTLLERLEEAAKRQADDAKADDGKVGELEERVRELESERLTLRTDFLALSKERKEFREKALAGKLGVEGPPRMCVGAVIVHPVSGAVVLGRRLQRDCGHGKIILPGGGMEGVESIEDGVKREVREETGLAVEVRRLIMLYRHVSAPWLNNVIAWHLVEPIDPCKDPRAGDDLADPAYYSRETIGKLHGEGKLSRIAARVLAQAFGWTELDS